MAISAYITSFNSYLNYGSMTSFGVDYSAINNYVNTTEAYNIVENYNLVGFNNNLSYTINIGNVNVHIPEYDIIEPVIFNKEMVSSNEKLLNELNQKLEEKIINLPNEVNSPEITTDDFVPRSTR